MKIRNLQFCNSSGSFATEGGKFPSIIILLTKISEFVFICLCLFGKMLLCSTNLRKTSSIPSGHTVTVEREKRKFTTGEVER